MRVGVLNGKWDVRCGPLIFAAEGWRKAGPNVPAVCVGSDDHAKFYSYVIIDHATDREFLEVRVAAEMGVEPRLVVENGRVLVVTDGWVAEVDVEARAIAWEALGSGPVVGVWALESGNLVVIWETEAAAVDRRGRKLWSVTMPGMGLEIERVPPLIIVTGDKGERIEIDEDTGEATVGRGSSEPGR